MRTRQLSFLPPTRREYAPTQGKRKIRRPFDPKRALHVTLKSGRARGRLSLLAANRRLRVQNLMVDLAQKWDVRVYRFANVGNHLHLLLSARTKRSFQAFLREFAGAVAVAATGSAKGRPAKFWDGSPWSKIVEFGRQFANTSRYILLNVLESSGLRDRAALSRLERDGMLVLGPAPPGRYCPAS